MRSRLTNRCYLEEEGLRGMDLAEEDWDGYVDGANKISPGGTFSDVAWLCRPEE